MILTQHGINSLPRGGGGGFVEIGGRQYPTVKIGNQLWMAENLDYKGVFKVYDGRSTSAYNPTCTYYNLNEAQYGYNGLKYGLYYNGYCMSGVESILPEGWRIPTDDDFNDLISAVGSTNSSSITRSDFGGSDDTKFGLPYCGYGQTIYYSGVIDHVNFKSFETMSTLWSRTPTASNGHHNLIANVSNIFISKNSETSDTVFRPIRLVKDT